MSCSTPRSSRQLSFEMPTPYSTSNSAILNGRRDLVLDDLDPDPVADRLGALLEGLDAAQIEALRGVELQRPAARLGLGAAEADPDLLADLVREQADGLRPVEVAGELAERLRHQPRLQADLDLAHLALELDPRRQRRDRVDGDEIDRSGAGQHVDDLERLLAVVGLGDQQLVGVDADPPRVDRIDRVLGVDERADAAPGLSLGDDVVDERRLARGLGAEDLDDPAARARRRRRAPGRATAPRSGSSRRPSRSCCPASSPSRRRTRARSA